MTKKTKKQPKPKKQRQKAEQKKSRFSPIALILGGATLIGVPAGVVAFWPRVTATVSDPVDSTNPFSAIVTIANTGYLPLVSVEPVFKLGKMTFGSPLHPTTIEGYAGEKYGRVKSTNWHSAYLGIDDKFTFGLNEIWGKQPDLLSADVAILVDYKIPIIHWRREKRFPLSAVRQTIGNFYWYSTPVGMDHHSDKWAFPQL
jgi:hypothetical protein